MTLADRLRKAREDRGLKQEDLAKLAGSTQQQINTIETGKSLKPRNLKKIALALGISPAWLEYGDTGKSNVEPVEHLPLRRVPVINYVQAGNPREVIDDFSPGAGLDIVTTDLDIGPYAFALIIRGSSMEPDFKAGDKVIIDPDVGPSPGDFVVAKCTEQEVTFKKYRPRGIDDLGNEVFELVPLNEDYATIRSDSKFPCQIIGTMVEHRRYRRK